MKFPRKNTENVATVIYFFSRQVELVLDSSKFYRIHRFGRICTGKPRPIVAKFVLYNDKESTEIAKEA